MEATGRKPFQGITNIIRFNWHYYLLAVVLITLLLITTEFVPDYFLPYFSLSILLIVLSSVFSLLISFYIYDYAGLYTFNWLPDLSIPAGAKILNIHAGFDETSKIIADRYPSARIHVFDFYDPKKHTEVSIKRARKAYPSFPGTESFYIPKLPVAAAEADCIFVIFAAHEIRDREERVVFFTELRKSLKHGGKIVVTEHLRDVNNFIAYNMGFFHFLSKKEWKRTFEAAGVEISRELKVTPFISVFILN